MAYVQSKATRPAGNTASTTVAATFTTNVTAGNTLVAFFTSDDNNNPTAVGDSLNGANAWSVACPRSATTIGIEGTMYYFPNTAGGACTVTVTFLNSCSNRTIIIGEYSGLATSNTVDVSTSNATTTPTTTPNAGAMTTTQSGDLVVVGIYTPGSTSVNITSGSALSFTVRETGNDTFNDSSALEDGVQAGAGSVTPDFTLDTSLTYVCCAASFKAPAGVGNPAQLFLH